MRLRLGWLTDTGGDFQHRKWTFKYRADLERDVDVFLTEQFLGTWHVHVPTVVPTGPWPTRRVQEYVSGKARQVP